MFEQMLICRVLDSRSVDVLLGGQLSLEMFLAHRRAVEFILEHKRRYGDVPDRLVFAEQFRDFEFVQVEESEQYIIDRIREAYLYSRMVPVIREASDKVRVDANEALRYLQEGIERLERAMASQRGGGRDIVAMAAERYAEFARRCDTHGLLGVSTGLSLLDEYTHGWMGEDLVVIFARTNMGKSWILLFFLVQAWIQGKKVVLYSGEMGDHLVGFRFDTFLDHFSNLSLMHGTATAEEQAAYLSYADALRQQSGFVVLTQKDFGGRKPTVDDLRQAMKDHAADILGIDQLTLMVDARKGENKRVQYTNIAEDLYSLSEELQKPILAVTQANRESVKNKSKDVAPELHEIGESDGIAQNATRCISMNVLDSVLKLSIKKNRYGLNNKEVLLLWDIDKGNVRPMLEGGAAQQSEYNF